MVYIYQFGQKCKEFKVLALFLLLVATNSPAANRYWIANTAGSWHDPANWATTSGGAGGSSIPNLADIAVFDVNGSGDCIISADMMVDGLHMLSGFAGNVSASGNPIITIANSGFVQQSGSFYGASAFIEVLSPVVLTGGVFISSDDMLRIGGQYMNDQTIFSQSGTNVFLPNYGTVAFCPDGGCEPMRFTITSNNNTVFNKVFAEAQSSCSPATPSTLEVSNGSMIRVSGELHHNDGILNGQWSCNGDLFVNAAADAGVGTITFAGAQMQSYYRLSGAGSTCRIVIDKTGGMVLPGSTTSDFAVNAFALINGDFQMPSDTFYIEGIHTGGDTIFTQRNGIIDHNEGWVAFVGYDTAQSYVSAQISGSNINLNNVALMAAPSPETFVLQIASSGTLHIENTLVLGNGSLVDGTLILEGDIFVEPGFTSSNSTVVFTGNNTQIVDLSTNTSALNGNITINKSASDVLLSSPLTLDASGQSIVFTSGILQTNSSSPLVLGSQTTVSGANNLSHVSGPTTKLGSAAFEFPIGNGIYFAPIGISSCIDGTTAITAEYLTNFVAPSSTGDPVIAPLATVSDCEQWSLIQNNGSDSVFVTMYWNAPQSCAIASTQDVSLAYNTANSWTSLGASVVAGSASSGNATSASPIQPNGILTLGNTLTTSVNASNTNAAFSASPNPFSDIVELNASGAGQVIVMDYLGRTVLAQNCQAGKNILNTSTLIPGAYTIYYSDNTFQQSVRLIKL